MVMVTSIAAARYTSICHESAQEHPSDQRTGADPYCMSSSNMPLCRHITIAARSLILRPKYVVLCPDYDVCDTLWDWTK